MSPILQDQEEPADSELGRAIAGAREIGWRRAVEQVFEPGFVDYIASPKRLRVLDVLPLRPDQAILEIGPGYGQMTVVIAPQVATVDAVEASLGQSRFCAIRCAQEGLDNVRVIAGGADGRLPYADQSFDGVVMNLVFEWCAYRAAELGHEAVQRAYLAEIARVLKPGGFLFLSTKNRYALRLLLGGRDEHARELRFGSALPRWLTRTLARNRTSKFDGGYLHSYTALRSMIEKAGFGDLQDFWAAPEMRWPTDLVPLEGRAIAEARARPGFKSGTGRYISQIMRVLPAGLIKHLSPGLTFLATRKS